MKTQHRKGINIKEKFNTFLFFVSIFTPALLFAQQAPGIQWQKCYGGANDENISSGSNRTITQTVDGGYAVCGRTTSTNGDVEGFHGDSSNTNSDAWIIKFTSAGVIQWQKCLGGTSQDRANCIIQTLDGGYAIAGYTESKDGDVSGKYLNSGIGDAWILKLDTLGNIQWQVCIGGTELSYPTYAYSIIQIGSGEYIVAGSELFSNEGCNFSPGSSNALVLKLSSSGNVLWQRCYGGSKGDLAYSITQTFDCGYAFVGETQSSDGDVSGYHNDTTNLSGYLDGFDVWVVKLDSFGMIQWQKCLGGSQDDNGNSIIQTSDSGFVIGGATSSNDGDVSGNHGGSDAWIVKLNSKGTIEWQKCIGGKNTDQIFSITHTSDSGFVFTGLTTSSDGDVSGLHGDILHPLTDAWVVKLNSLGNIQWQKCLGGSNDDRGVSIIQTNDGGFAVNGFTSSDDGDVSGNHGGSDLWVVKLNAVYNVIENANPYLGPSNYLLVYPNPSWDQVHLQLWVSQTVRQVVLYDIVGREIHPSYDISGNIVTVDVKALSPGIYISRVTFSYQDYTGIFTHLLIVQH